MIPTLNAPRSMPIATATPNLEQEVMGWFAAGHEILWIPIYEVGAGPSGMVNARAEAERFGGPRLIRDEADFLALPPGIKGWLFPAHRDDTDVICAHEAPGEISVGHLHNPITGQRLSWRYDTESEL